MFINQKCPHINCYITYDQNTLTNVEDFDAVVFEINDVIKLDVNFLNLTRSPEQLYIFRSSETPEKHPVCQYDLDDFFNWTWTYKLSSDIPQPFLNVYYTNHTIVGPVSHMSWQLNKLKKVSRITSKIMRKRKAVAWVLTKCKLKTKHQDFIMEFKSEMKGYNYTLDIYGPCGRRKCPGGSALKCYKMLEKEYFFVVVLEEYLTEDYVTEVMVSAMSHLAIPIVMGPSDYSNFLPPGSFINVRAFDMKKLGALIDYLIKNPDMYEFFFDWKKYYYYSVRPRSRVCDLCTKLNEYNGSNVVKTDFRKWWNPEYKDVCQRMKLYKYFNNNG
uniref:Fucosyltransferase n=1 Tax=Heliothis virescens TaxID=7102 RepID=A0A2A4J0X4_HELVI